MAISNSTCNKGRREQGLHTKLERGRIALEMEKIKLEKERLKQIRLDNELRMKKLYMVPLVGLIWAAYEHRNR